MTYITHQLSVNCKGVPCFPSVLASRFVANRALLNLSSNDYLGLAQPPAIVEAMRDALLSEGAGASASRLVTGNHPPYGQLEAALADWQNCEAALVFANGYMANVGVVSALVGRGDAVFSDAQPRQYCGWRPPKPSRTCTVSP